MKLTTPFKNALKTNERQHFSMKNVRFCSVFSQSVISIYFHWFSRSHDSLYQKFQLRQNWCTWRENYIAIKKEL